MSDARWQTVLERARGEVREGRSLVGLLERELGGDERAGLERTSFLLLRPDALASGQGAAIAAHVAGELGAVPVAIRVLDVPPALVDAAYHRQPKIARDRAWLLQSALRTGPLAALLVASPEPRDPGLSEWLYAHKGPTSTLEAPDDESLRARFARTSSVHAVVHVPESLAAFVAEASLFFPWEQIRGAAAARPLPEDAVAELVTLEPRPGRLVFQAALKVKRRIGAALAVRSSPPVALTRLRELMAQTDHDLERAAYLDQRDRMLAFAAEERPLLEAALADAGAPAVADAGSKTYGEAWRLRREAEAPYELLTISWILSGHEAWGGDGGERLFETLAGHDVPLTGEQRNLLAAGLAHDLHPGSRYEGERAWPLGPDPGGASG